MIADRSAMDDPAMDSVDAGNMGRAAMRIRLPNRYITNDQFIRKCRDEG